MFGNFFKSLSTGKDSIKILHVLTKTYSLSVTHPQQLDMVDRVAREFSGVLNEHEMAVQYLAEFSKTIKTDHPQAIREIEKYIRMSKGAYSRGLANARQPQEALFQVARERFGVNPESIHGV